MMLRHKKYGHISEADGKQLIKLDDGEKWKLENVEIVKNLSTSHNTDYDSESEKDSTPQEDIEQSSTSHNQ